VNFVDNLVSLAAGNSQTVLLLTRIILGAVMVYHGWPKIKDLKANGSNFTQMGFKPGIFWGTIVAIVEFFGGLGMLIGLYSEIAAILFGLQMIVGTIWQIKIGKKFPDYSVDLQLLVLCLVILTFGPGRLVVNL
jgi:uncharacterized membrane protein YphA (DoxX/SURF4 family)